MIGREVEHSDLRHSNDTNAFGSTIAKTPGKRSPRVICIGKPNPGRVVALIVLLNALALNIGILEALELIQAQNPSSAELNALIFILPERGLITGNIHDLGSIIPLLLFAKTSLESQSETLANDMQPFLVMRCHAHKNADLKNDYHTTPTRGFKFQSL